MPRLSGDARRAHVRFRKVPLLAAAGSVLAVVAGTSVTAVAAPAAPETHSSGYAPMTSALAAEDPDARVIPYCMSAGTDAKSFSRLGMRCFGFVPLRLPPDLDFSGMFHGIDERIPVDALLFGTRVLDRFLGFC